MSLSALPMICRHYGCVDSFRETHYPQSSVDDVRVASAQYGKGRLILRMSMGDKETFDLAAK